MLFYLRKSFFLNSCNDHIDSLRSCCFKHEKRKFAISGDKTKPT